MAETILDALQSKTGGSTSVQILPVDVYGNSETTSTFDVANGIVQAVNNGANIINLSLGGTSDSPILHNTITQVSQQGIPIYAAAGNDPVTTPTYPAAYPEVIAVTATDSTGNIASYANRGSFIDMTAPGDNVSSFRWPELSASKRNFHGDGVRMSGAAAGLAWIHRTSAPIKPQSLLQKIPAQIFHPQDRRNKRVCSVAQALCPRPRHRPSKKRNANVSPHLQLVRRFQNHLALVSLAGLRGHTPCLRPKYFSQHK